MGCTLRFLGRNFGLLLALGIYGGLVAITPPGPPRLAGPRVVLPRHEAKVVAFAPGGRVMLTDGDSGGCLRDVATGRVLRPLVGEPGDGEAAVVRQITCPRFTPDGRRLVVQVGGPRFTGPQHRVHVVSLRVFDVATGRQQARFDRVGADTWFGSSMPPPEYALSADGSALAFCRQTDRHERRITAWDLEAGRTIGEFAGSPPLALSPDGGVVAFAETEPDRPKSPLPPTLRRIRPARPLATRIDPVPAFPGLGVGPVAFSDDGRKVATLSANNQPVVAEVPPDLPSPPQLQEPDGTAPPRPRFGFFAQFSPKGLRFNPDARLVFVDQYSTFGDGAESVIWDVSGPAPTQVYRGPVPTSSVVPEAGITAIAHYVTNSRWNPSAEDNSEVRISQLPSPKPHLRFTTTNVHAAAISPDGRWLALPSDRRVQPRPDLLTRAFQTVLGLVGIRTGGSMGPETRIREIQLRDAATGRHVASVDWNDRGNDPALPQVEFAPDGKTLVLRTAPGPLGWSSEHPMIDWSVELWDVPRDGPRRRVASGPIAGLIVALFVAGLGSDTWRRRRSAPAPV